MHGRCNCNHGSSSDDGKLLTGIVIGGILGAGLAVYLSTDRGKEQLKEIKTRVKKYGEQLEDRMEEYKSEKIDPLLEEAKTEFEDTVKKLKSNIGDVKSKKL